MNKENTEILGTGKFLRLVNKGTWEYVERTVGSGVIMVAPVYQGKLILIEQYRPSVDRRVVELPAGIAGDGDKIRGESLEQAARRELLEEAGFVAETMTLMVEGPVSSGLSSEIVSFYLARGLKKVSAGGGDETESIEVHEVELDRVLEWSRERAKTGVLIDPKIFTGLHFALTTESAR